MTAGIHAVEHRSHRCGEHTLLSQWTDIGVDRIRLGRIRLSWRIGWVILGGMTCATVLAQTAPVTISRDVANQAQTNPARTHTQIVSPETTSEDRASRDRAQQWGLRAEEWTRYQDLMQGPLGIYSPNLDPLTALGIEARNDEERAHYAQLQVQAEARRVERILAYQRAYDAAWQQAFPGQVRISLPGAQGSVTNAPNSGLATTDRLAVFVKPDCAPCAARVHQLQAAGMAFDLYLVGSRQDDGRLRQWALDAGIDPAKVRARAITLNHDAGRWLSLGLPGELPAAVREVNGQWQRQ